MGRKEEEREMGRGREREGGEGERERGRERERCLTCIHPTVIRSCLSRASNSSSSFIVSHESALPVCLGIMI